MGNFQDIFQEFKRENFQKFVSDADASVMAL